MGKIRLKFGLSIVFFVVTIGFYLFYDEFHDILYNYVFLVFFVYFIYDSLSVSIPAINKYLPSSKHYSKYFKEIPNYNSEKLAKIKKDSNIRALITFVLYFGVLTIIGIIYLNNDYFNEIHIYLLFLLANMADYFSILFWCPFRNVILKNSCCYTCRIANWDRLMKFYILIFIPNVFTITLVILGIAVFLIWEYNHHVHPERFYFISNEVLRCNSCNETLCDKKKEQL